jgi:uncharacterized protein (DUF1501 family)
MNFPTDRRSLVKGGLAGMALGAFAPRLAFAAAPTDQRFVFIIQRGAADGLHIVPPLGDPGFAALRGPFLASLAAAQKIDATFSLHPSLTETGKLFTAKQGLAVHALATGYRDRSHFDGQDVLETGNPAPYAERTGWMNRMLALLPPGGNRALALAADVPVALRGARAVTSYAPSALPRAGDDTMARVTRLYADDAELTGLWSRALATRSLVGAKESSSRAPAELGRIAASLLAPADGARVMMIETTGWDTHSGQTGRLAAQLTQLDKLIGAMVTGLGPAWSRTMVLVATEFGRTAAVNGTQGTDHGTGSAALLLGGGLTNGGRVLADWPGLAPGALYENRDLKPTQSIEGLAAGAVAAHFGLDPARTLRTLYPAQASVRAVMV